MINIVTWGCGGGVGN